MENGGLFNLWFWTLQSPGAGDLQLLAPASAQVWQGLLAAASHG